MEEGGFDSNSLLIWVRLEEAGGRGEKLVVVVVNAGKVSDADL